MKKTYVAFDLETTGLRPETDQIIEIGALKVVDGKVTDRFMEFVKPDAPITSAITKITGITNEMVSSARPTEEIIRDFIAFCGDHILIGHNVMFDYKFTKRYANQYGYAFEKKGIDTLKIARKVHADFPSKSLEALCNHYEIQNQAAHRAYHDALATAKLYQCLMHYFEEAHSNLFEPAPLLYKLPKVQPATKKQIEYLLALCHHHKRPLQEDVQKMTRSQTSKLIDQIISEYGQM